MIGFLRGELLAVESDNVIVLTHGVGYEVLCAGSTTQSLAAATGTVVELWTYTHAREDALQLFGFAKRAEKDLFLALLKVNGVGPKMALSILSGAPADRIEAFIDAGDAKSLSALPRVGKKTAEQIILTLQGKLTRVATPAPATSAQKQVQTALLNLGFKTQKVDEFVAGLPAGIDVEEGVRRGLTALSSAL